MAAIAYTLLQRAILCQHGTGSRLAKSMEHDLKGKLSIAAYAAAILCAQIEQWISDALYISVATVWFIPDKRLHAAARE
ncbi:MAG: hypothetical protein NDJ18_02250 [candidate division Zixibacteria bacterium]|nr:hypothetical protein [candidate division Zixibacteria bacterium]